MGTHAAWQKLSTAADEPAARHGESFSRSRFWPGPTGKRAWGQRAGRLRRGAERRALVGHRAVGGRLDSVGTWQDKLQLASPPTLTCAEVSPSVRPLVACGGRV